MRLLTCAALAAALILAACGDDPADEPPDKIDVAELPLAPGFTIASDIERCVEGTEGETNGHCEHLLVITGPAELSQKQIVKTQQAFLVSQGWATEPKGITIGMDRDDCEATVDLVTVENELIALGPIRGTGAAPLAPEVRAHRKALIAAAKKGAAMSATLAPEQDRYCVVG